MLALLLALAMTPEDVFVSGAEGFDTYRIPALALASDGALLAFAEGRKNIADQAENQIVLKRRPKGGTWQKLQVVASEDQAALNNPCVLTLPHGRVLLMVQRYPTGVRESNAPPGLEGPNILRCLILESKDNGKTWGKPTDITKQAKRSPEIRTVASGPGIGIRLSEGKHKGRLIFPMNERDAGGWRVFALYSDDSGKSWRAGKPAPQAADVHANEVQMAETGPDQVLLNARNQGKDHHRLQATSRDGGETWSEAKPVAGLVDPICMGSLIRSPKGGLFFSNPDDPITRRNGTIYRSRDVGDTWLPIAHLPGESFGYSSLCVPRADVLGCLYETTSIGPTGKEHYTLRYAEFPINPSVTLTNAPVQARRASAQGR